MVQPNSSATEFAEILKLQCEQTERLLELLRQENRLLQQHAPQALEELTAVKQKQLQILEETVHHQHRFLQQQGLSADRQGAETFISKLPESSPLRQQWRNLQELLEVSRKQNEINGAIVALSRRQVTHTLDLLQSNRQGQKTYNRSGESSTSRPSNSFGKA